MKVKRKNFKKSVEIIKEIFNKYAFKIFEYNDKTERYDFLSTRINQGLYLILMLGFIPYEKYHIMGK